MGEPSKEGITSTAMDCEVDILGRKMEDEDDSLTDDDCTSTSTCTASSSSSYYCSSRWKILGLGQLISLLYAAGGAIQSTMKLQCNFSAPTFSSGLFYACLSLNLVPLYWKRSRSTVQKEDSEKKKDDTEYGNRFLGFIPVEGSPWIYLVMGLMDLEAFYFTILALRYTTLTSVTILGSLATPAAMVFSRILLKRSYTWVHLLGVSVCLAGTGFNLLSDLRANNDISNNDGDSLSTENVYDRKLLGDLFAIIGGSTFGLSDVLCEKAVRHLGSTQEYLGCSGFCAAVIAFFQAAFLEMEAIRQFFGILSTTDAKDEPCSARESWTLMAAFLMTHTLSYYSSAKFLEISESALLSLSTLTENLWSILFSVLVQQIVPNPLFYGALVFSAGGVCIYETAPSPIVETHLEQEGDHESDLEMQVTVQKGDYEEVLTRNRDNDEAEGLRQDNNDALTELTLPRTKQAHYEQALLSDLDETDSSVSSDDGSNTTDSPAR